MSMPIFDVDPRRGILMRFKAERSSIGAGRRYQGRAGAEGRDGRLSPVLRKLKLVHLERIFMVDGVDSAAKVCSVGMAGLLRDYDVSEVEARNILKECRSILEGGKPSQGAWRYLLVRDGG
eukprot:gene14290-biopygen601